MERRIVLLDAQADRREAVLPSLLEQGGEQLVAEAPSAAAGDDGDRQLRGRLVEEGVAGAAGGEQPVPGGADWKALVERDQSAVSGAPQRQ